MGMPTQDEIQRRFPVGDRIEYQTSNGKFSGIIAGYESDKYGISLNLGDRRFPILSEKDFKLAEKYHKPAQPISEESEQVEIVLKKVKSKIRTTNHTSKLEQLTLF